MKNQLTQGEIIFTMCIIVILPFIELALVIWTEQPVSVWSLPLNDPKWPFAEVKHSQLQE
jgi:hypothetical protein